MSATSHARSVTVSPHEPIPLVDLQAQYASIRKEVDEAIGRVVGTAQFIMGPDIAAFEQEFAAGCAVPYCVGVGSGTAALELALRAFDIGPGDEVITTAHSFIATAEAISMVGARPVFVDIDAQTYTLDPGAMEAAITSRTRAVIPVHIYGQTADMDAIMEIAHRRGLVVIEDAAQAHAATWAGRPAGGLGDAACFSFYPGKNLGAYGDAGALTTGRGEIAERVRLLRNHGRRSKYLHEVKGYGHRLDTLQAAILRAKLPHLEQWTAARRRLAARYTGVMQANPGMDELGVVYPVVASKADSAWHLYVVRVPDRDRVLAELVAAGVGAGVHYPVPLHLQPAYTDLGYDVGALPITEAVADSCLSLPLYPEMTTVQQDRVIDVLHMALLNGARG